MNTERLYSADPYLRSIKSRILSVGEKDGRAVLVFDRTVFFPEGGGQPCDLGTVESGYESHPGIYNVIDTYEDDDRVYHVIDAPPQVFTAGETMILEIDWERRFRHMQRHAGEHILSGAFYKLYGGANKGFHMGEHFITIDIDLGGRRITDEMLDEAEDLANEVIWRDLPITVSSFSDASQVSVLPVRKDASSIEGTVTVVTVGDPSDPADCVACCGTHPSSSGQIGLIKIYKAEPNKGMTRIYFDCGKAALDYVRSEMKLFHSVKTRFSAGSDDITDKLDIKDARETDLRRRLARLSDNFRSQKQEELLVRLGDAGSGSVVERIDLLEPGDLVKLGMNTMAVYSSSASAKESPASAGGTGPLLVLVHPDSRTVLLFSIGRDGDHDCSLIVREKAIPLGAKGGGKPDNARAVFPDIKAINEFLDALSG